MGSERFWEALLPSTMANISARFTVCFPGGVAAMYAQSMGRESSNSTKPTPAPTRFIAPGMGLGPPEPSVPNAGKFGPTAIGVNRELTLDTVQEDANVQEADDVSVQTAEGETVQEVNLVMTALRLGVAVIIPRSYSSK